MLNSHMFADVGEILNNEVNYECIGCKVVNNVLVDTDDFDFSSSTSERGMGPETIYEAEIILECKSCSEENMLEVILCEYPSEAYNSHDIKINGKELM